MNELINLGSSLEDAVRIGDWKRTQSLVAQIKIIYPQRVYLLLLASLGDKDYYGLSYQNWTWQNMKVYVALLNSC